MKSKDPEESRVSFVSKPSGVVLINKPKGKTSFSLVSRLRKLCDVQKVGHAGTLDPFATGVMVLLVGKEYTRLSDRFLHQDKEYIATLHLGKRTDSYDIDGSIVSTSDLIPSLSLISETLKSFQGIIWQTPPMFSAKKVQGKKLYELARKGIEIPRKPVQVSVAIEFLSYQYPFLEIKVSCSKGTYIRSLTEDIGLALGCGAHLSDLSRTRSGSFLLSDCLDGNLLSDSSCFSLLRFIPLDQLQFN
jgi:tRNA pseudouridine55 synthase